MSGELPIQKDESFVGYAYRAFIAPDGRLRSVWRFVLSVVVVVAANVAAGIVASAFGRGRVFELVYRPLSLVFVVAGFCLLLKLADGVEGNPVPAMGLGFRKPWLGDAVKGLAIGFFMIFVAYLVIRSTCELTVNITLNGRAAKLLVMELVTLAAAAMLEEVMFRGYPFQRLVESFSGSFSFLAGHISRQIRPEIAASSGAFTAAVLWSAAFGAMHFDNPDASIWSFLNTSFVGVLFCFAYLRTRSLWMPWGIHFAWNTTLGVILGLPVSGLTQFGVVVRSKADGPRWITGGSYGIEASALGTAVILVGIAIVLIFVKPRTVFEMSVQSPGSAGNEIRAESIQQNQKA